jgi:hypothetical protein
VNEVVAALIGATIGAVAGVAGGGFAALAAIRASQVAARAELAPKLHALAGSIISLHGAIGTDNEMKARRNIELAWNDFGVHQRVLCPSRALEMLAYLIRRTTKEEENFTPEALLTIVGQAEDKASRIVGFYSESLFRFRAQQKERKLVADWLAGDAHGLLGDELRQKFAEDVGLSRRQRKRIKPANDSP